MCHGNGRHSSIAQYWLTVGVFALTLLNIARPPYLIAWTSSSRQLEGPSSAMPKNANAPVGPSYASTSLVEDKRGVSSACVGTRRLCRSLGYRVAEWRSPSEVPHSRMARPSRGSSPAMARTSRRRWRGRTRRRAPAASPSSWRIPMHRTGPSRTGCCTTFPRRPRSWENTRAAQRCGTVSAGQAYGGPCPPPGHGSHRYVFTLFALDVSTLDIHGRTREALERSLHAHTLATARLMGRYERKSKR
jgi:hypothetical protein